MRRSIFEATIASMRSKNSFEKNPARRRSLAFIVAAAGFVINVVAFYPGLLSPDSLDQYGQALHNEYGDWHPPAMAALWHLLLFIYNGPQPMLFFQELLLWSSCFFLFNAFLKHYPQLSFLVPFFFLAPFVQNFSGNIWKDMHMGCSWLLSASLMISAWLDGRKLRPWLAATLIIFIFYGCWARISGFPGMIPLLALWWILTIRSPKLTRLWVTPIAACLLTVASLSLEKIFSTFVLKAKQDHIEYKLIAHDLTGLSVKSGEWLFPDYISTYAGFDTAYLRKKYVCYSFDNVWWNDDNRHILPELNETQLANLKMYWLNTILKHPVSYLKNKTNGFLFFLRLKDSGNRLTVMQAFTTENNYGFTFKPNLITQLLIQYVSIQKENVYMKPWFWFILNILLLLWVMNRRFAQLRVLLTCLLLSSFLYLCPHFVTFPAETEFRYFYWNCLSLSVSCLLMLASLLAAKRPVASLPKGNS